MIFYSQSKCGFYDSSIHGSGIPSDAVKITADERNQLLIGQSSGKQIVSDKDGRPILKDPDTSNSAVFSCTPAQGLVALFSIKGITEDDVLAAINQIQNPEQKYTARIGYQRATTWERSSPTMQMMASLLGLSDEDMDALFAKAITVQV